MAHKLLKMRKPFFTICCSLFFLACGRGTPYGILSKDKMQEVVWEMAQGNEYLASYVYARNPEINTVALNDAMIERICKVNKISKETLNKSLKYYQENPEDFVIILDSVVAQQRRAKGDTAISTDPALNNPLRPTLVQ